MKKFLNLNMGTKIILSIFSMFLIIVTVSYLGISNILHMSKNFETAYNINTIPLTNLLEIGITYQTTRVYLGELIITKNKEEQDKYIAKIKELDTVLDKNLEEFEKSLTSNDIRLEFNKLRQNLDNYHSVKEKAINMLISGKHHDAISCIKENFTLARAVDTSIRKLSEMKTLQVKENFEENSRLASATIKHCTVVIILSLIKGLFVGYSLFKMHRIKK